MVGRSIPSLVGYSLGTVFVVVIAVVLIVGAVVSKQNWDKDCFVAGGHIISKTDWYTDSNGDLQYDTDYYCLNSDGGIIDIY